MLRHLPRVPQQVSGRIEFRQSSSRVQMYTSLEQNHQLKCLQRPLAIWMPSWLGGDCGYQETLLTHPKGAAMTQP